MKEEKKGGREDRKEKKGKEGNRNRKEPSYCVDRKQTEKEKIILNSENHEQDKDNHCNEKSR